MVLDQDLLDDLTEAYNKTRGDGKITKDNLGDVFKAAGEGVPSFKIRDILETMKKGANDEISLEEFSKIFLDLNLNKTKGREFKQNVQTKSGVTQVSGYEQTSAGTVHMVTDAERASFSHFINVQLENDPDCKSYLPLNPETDGLFKVLSDGVLLCKLVNIAAANTIDERAISKKKLNNFTATENLTMALNSAKGIGCHIVNIGSEDIKQGRVHLCLGILWQLIRKYYLLSLSLIMTPDLLCLLREGETAEDLQALSPEELLLRWVEYQIRKAGCENKVTNFGTDLSDSVVYAALETAIMPDKMHHSRNKILNEKDLMNRGKMITDNSQQAGIAKLVSPYDIVSGNSKLNVLYIADMFNKYPSLQQVKAEVIEETREEKSYRNWMNSMGVSPHIIYLYANLSDGTVFLQLFNIIHPGSVEWEKVNKPPYKANQAMLKKTENCNQVVAIAKRLNLSCVGLAGKDIAECSKIHVLGLVWQIMRMYTLQMLSKLSGNTKPLTDQEIVNWVNEKFTEKGKTMKISSFKDHNVITSHAIFHLVEALREGSVNWAIVNNGDSDEDKMNNAKLALSLARKIGAIVYALPEDIIEGKTKMIMTVFACLMVVSYAT